MQAPLAGYAANGALVHYLDLTIVGNTIRANPAAFGLASADACTAACVQNPAVASQFLFYVDRVHLTSAGFAIVAEYFQRQIEAPGFLEAGTDIGLSGGAVRPDDGRPQRADRRE
jgi:phospholipase/lecithinase/hemolysin